jgi:hypothetical protein
VIGENRDLPPCGAKAHFEGLTPYFHIPPMGIGAFESWRIRYEQVKRILEAAPPNTRPATYLGLLKPYLSEQHYN